MLRTLMEQLVARTAGDLGRPVTRAADDLGPLADLVASRVADVLGHPSPGACPDRTVRGVAARLAAHRGTEALAGVILFADGMSDAEREARLRDDACARSD